MKLPCGFRSEMILSFIFFPPSLNRLEAWKLKWSHLNDGRNFSPVRNNRENELGNYSKSNNGLNGVLRTNIEIGSKQKMTK